jgi:hypothetical protein
VHGTPVRLNRAAVQAIGLRLHALAQTAKYSALSIEHADEGEVDRLESVITIVWNPQGARKGLREVSQCVARRGDFFSVQADAIGVGEDIF